MKQYKNTFCAAACCIAIALPTCAAAEETPEIVVSANLTPSTLEETGSSVSLITREQIEATRRTSVIEMLRSLPGVDVTQSGGRGRVSGVYIRGADTDQTLVLIDGVKANDANVGGYDFADLNTANIERIEVVRGPQSVLYGSDAIGGVINIITRKAAEGPSAAVSAGAGNHSTYEYRAHAGYGNELFDTANSITYFDTDGVSAASERNGNTERDEYENITASTRTGLNFLGDGRADATFRFIKGDTELDDFEFGVGPVDALNYTQKREVLTGSLTASKSLGEYIVPRVELGIYDEDLEGRDPDSEFNNFDIKQTTTSATAAVDIEPIEENTITLGYTNEHRKGENIGNFNKSRQVNSFFLEDQLRWTPWATFTGGVRYDDDSDFGSETTYRATMSVRPPDTGMRMHGSVGSGFKAPSFNELYFPNFGNPDLDPETSLGWDVGLGVTLFEDITADVTYFRSEIDDLITFDSITFLAENIDSASIHGVEFTLNAKLCEQLSGSAQYTYTDAENDETGTQLARRPKHRGSLDLFFEPVENLTGSITLLVVRDRIDSDGSDMDDYTRVDASLQYTLLEKVTPFLRVENLFDEDYEEINGYSTPGFEIFGGVEVAL
ncbi:MAG: TonB-dependent receptor [Bdellovibrionales bacterium]|nr:TonB-dependent receptor [Bdellovibrionales bacterium]